MYIGIPYKNHPETCGTGPDWSCRVIISTPYINYELWRLLGFWPTPTYVILLECLHCILYWYDNSYINAKMISLIHIKNRFVFILLAFILPNGLFWVYFRVFRTFFIDFILMFMYIKHYIHGELVDYKKGYIIEGLKRIWNCWNINDTVLEQYRNKSRMA